MKVNISDMLDHTVADVEDLSPEAVNPERIKRLALAQIQTERKGRMIVVGKKQFSLKVLVVAATLCLFTATAYAAVQFDWDARLANYLSPDKVQKEQLDEAGLIVNKQVTANGLTVDVKQVIGDKYSVYILCDITAPETVELTPDYTFDGVYLSLVDSTSLGYNFTILDDDNPNDNKCTLLFDLKSSESIQGKTLNLNLCDLGYYDDSVDSDTLTFKTVVSGDWKLSWEMAYKDVSQTIQVNQPVNFYGVEDTFTEINISPLSVTAIVKGEGVRAEESMVSTSMQPHAQSDSISDTGDNNLIASENPTIKIVSESNEPIKSPIENLGFIAVNMQDGTVLTTDNTSLSTEDDVLKFTNSFTKLLDLQQVKSITFGGITVPMQP